MLPLWFKQTSLIILILVCISARISGQPKINISQALVNKGKKAQFATLSRILLQRERGFSFNLENAEVKDLYIKMLQSEKATENVLDIASLLLQMYDMSNVTADEFMYVWLEKLNQSDGRDDHEMKLDRILYIDNVGKVRGLAWLAEKLLDDTKYHALIPKIMEFWASTFKNINLDPYEIVQNQLHYIATHIPRVFEFFYVAASKLFPNAGSEIRFSVDQKQEMIKSFLNARDRLYMTLNTANCTALSGCDSEPLLLSHKLPSKNMFNFFHSEPELTLNCFTKIYAEKKGNLKFNCTIENEQHLVNLAFSCAQELQPLPILPRYNPDETVFKQENESSTALNRLNESARVLFYLKNQDNYQISVNWNKEEVKTLITSQNPLKYLWVHRFLEALRETKGSKLVVAGFDGWIGRVSNFCIFNSKPYSKFLALAWIIERLHFEGPHQLIPIAMTFWPKILKNENPDNARKFYFVHLGLVAEHCPEVFEYFLRVARKTPQFFHNFGNDELSLSEKECISLLKKLSVHETLTNISNETIRYLFKIDASKRLNIPENLSISGDVIRPNNVIMINYMNLKKNRTKIETLPTVNASYSTKTDDEDSIEKVREKVETCLISKKSDAEEVEDDMKDVATSPTEETKVVTSQSEVVVTSQSSVQTEETKITTDNKSYRRAALLAVICFALGFSVLVAYFALFRVKRKAAVSDTEHNKPSDNEIEDYDGNSNETIKEAEEMNSIEALREMEQMEQMEQPEIEKMEPSDDMEQIV